MTSDAASNKEYADLNELVRLCHTWCTQPSVSCLQNAAFVCPTSHYVLVTISHRLLTFSLGKSLIKVVNLYDFPLIERSIAYLKMMKPTTTDELLLLVS